MHLSVLSYCYCSCKYHYFASTFSIHLLCIVFLHWWYEMGTRDGDNAQSAVGSGVPHLFEKCEKCRCLWRCATSFFLGQNVTLSLIFKWYSRLAVHSWVCNSKVLCLHSGPLCPHLFSRIPNERRVFVAAVCGQREKECCNQHLFSANSLWGHSKHWVEIMHEE